MHKERLSAMPKSPHIHPTTSDKIRSWVFVLGIPVLGALALYDYQRTEDERAKLAEQELAIRATICADAYKKLPEFPELYMRLRGTEAPNLGGFGSENDRKLLVGSDGGFDSTLAWACRAKNFENERVARTPPT